MASSLLFDFYDKIITVPIADTSLDLQFLINEIRSAEHNLAPGIAYDQIADAFGKQDLGGGVKVGITVILLDGWRVAFEARPGPGTVSVTVSGGNFVGEAGANPIAPTAFTQVNVAQSTSAALVSSSSDTNLVYLVETLRSMHPAFGNAFFWDPDNGNDSNAGTSANYATKTFAAAQALASAGHNDVIFCRPTGTTGTSTSTEQLTISKSNLKLRGPGISMQLIPTDTTTATLRVLANNVEISGLYISTAGTGTRNAVEISGDNVLIRDSWINNSRGHGIYLTSTARSRVLTTVVENSGQSGTGSGIYLDTDTTQALVSRSIVSENQNGVVLSGSGIENNVLENCLIYNNVSYGVDIGSGVSQTMVRGQNTIVNNNTNTRDLGTQSYIETAAGGASAADIADAVWDEVISGHNSTGTTGKTLKDAKLKATIASIK